MYFRSTLVSQFMEPITLTKSQARKIILHAAGLSRRAQFGKGKEAAYKVIDHLGYVQVDTNYVVERAHHHAIAARVPGYKTEWLGELQADERSMNSGRVIPDLCLCTNSDSRYPYTKVFWPNGNHCPRQKST